MEKLTTGIHHVTAVASDAQKNIVEEDREEIEKALSPITINKDNYE